MENERGNAGIKNEAILSPMFDSENIFVTDNSVNKHLSFTSYKFIPIGLRQRPRSLHVESYIAGKFVGNYRANSGFVFAVGRLNSKASIRSCFNSDERFYFQRWCVPTIYNSYLPRDGIINTNRTNYLANLYPCSLFHLNASFKALGIQLSCVGIFFGLLYELIQLIASRLHLGQLPTHRSQLISHYSPLPMKNPSLKDSHYGDDSRQANHKILAYCWKGVGLFLAWLLCCGSELCFLSGYWQLCVLGLADVGLCVLLGLHIVGK